MPGTAQIWGVNANPAAALAEALVAWWKMDEASGSALDAHYAYDLSDTTGSAGSTSGKVGNARSLTWAGNKYFSQPHTNEFSPGDNDFSMCAWVNFDSFPTAGGIILKTDLGITDFEYAVYWQGNIIFQVSSTVSAPSVGVAPPATGVWALVLAWHDAAANTINIQLNDGTPVSTSHSGGARLGSSGFTVGNYANNCFDGHFDEVAFFNGLAFTPAQRAWLWNSGNGRTYADLGATPTTRVNHALAANGGTATALSAVAGAEADGCINGDRKGLAWGSGGGWSASGSLPQWLQVEFDEAKQINQIDVFTVQDSYASPSEPTGYMQFSSYGATEFQVQYWDGDSWEVVSGGSVTGNNKIWRRFTFSAITTDKIRIYLTASPDGGARLVEVEAWGNA